MNQQEIDYGINGIIGQGSGQIAGSNSGAVNTKGEVTAYFRYEIPCDLGEAIQNLAKSLRITNDQALRRIMERGLTGLADDRGEG
jgi:hypothetical protein